MEDEIKKILNSMIVNYNLIDNCSEDNSHIDDYEYLLSVTAKELVTLGLPSVSLDEQSEATVCDNCDGAGGKNFTDGFVRCPKCNPKE